MTATHRDLESMVARGELREDLYYRLAVVPVVVPPLRKRSGDIGSLVQHFVRELSSARPAASIEPEAIALLTQAPWPGNVRQLRNFVERLVVLTDSDRIGAAEVRRQVSLVTAAAPPPAPPLSDPAPSSLPPASGPRTIDEDSLPSRRAEAEREALVRALERADNNRTQAARLLQVSRRTLYNKLRAHRLE